MARTTSSSDRGCSCAMALEQNPIATAARTDRRPFDRLNMVWLPLLIRWVRCIFSVPVIVSALIRSLGSRYRNIEELRRNLLARDAHGGLDVAHERLVQIHPGAGINVIALQDGVVVGLEDQHQAADTKHVDVFEQAFGGFDVAAIGFDGATVFGFNLIGLDKQAITRSEEHTS